MTSTPLDRPGLPEDILFIARRYPREAWPGHANLGMVTRFWLQRHDMFRELGTMIDGGLADYREGEVDAEAFRGWMVPRLQFLLGELEGHHSVEDFHYFPILRAAEPRLEPGFAALDGDHELIHGAMAGVAETANALLRRIAGGTGDLRAEGDRFAAASDRLIGGLRQHLADEEELVIPLILDRTEPGLGIG